MSNLLLPERHPVKDFFVLDVLDVVPRSDMASMEHPFFSLCTRPDRRTLTYEHGNNTLEIFPSHLGLPTVFDKDILIYFISHLIARKNRGQEVGRAVRLSTRDLLVNTNRPTNNLGYERLAPALKRLAGTRFETNIKTGDGITTKGFGLIDGYEYNRKGSMFTDRLRFMELELSEWLYRAVDGCEVLPIHRNYFRLRRPLDRRLYEIARKHCGTKQKMWRIGLDKLQRKTGSKQACKHFRAHMRQVVKDNHLPDYSVALENDGDQVVFYRRNVMAAAKGQTHITADSLDWLVNADAFEQARQIAYEKNRDFQALKQEFVCMTNAKGEEVRNMSGAFLGFIKSKRKL